MLLLFVILLLAGCYSANTPPRPTPGPTETWTLAPTQTPTRASPTAPPTETPQATPTATPQPTATTIPVTVDATVWTDDPQVPVLLYHRFLPINATNESPTKMMLSTFRDELQALYDAGFTLVPLASWVQGDLRLAPGRRPLILTMDDLFFADQIFLEADGTPSQRSGLGVLWQFSQEHPDFGFSAALFYNLGDKLYGNKQYKDWFRVSNGWEDALARVIAWCIEHNAMPYNHFYTHPRLAKMEPPDVILQLKRNEVRLQKLLELIGRDDLVPRPENIIALPYGAWPDSRGSRQAIADYRSIQGQPVLGILEADPHYEQRFIMPAPYTNDFSPLHIPRMSGRMAVIQQIIKNVDKYPAAQQCTLTLSQDGAIQVFGLAEAIRDAVSSGRCPSGVYAAEGWLFRADSTKVTTLEVLTAEGRRP